MKRFLVPLFFLSMLVIAFTTVHSEAATLAKGKTAQKQDEQNIQPLDEMSLRQNALKRLLKTIQEQNPSAPGLEQITLENMTIKDRVPMKVGSLDLWLVKIIFANPDPQADGNSRNVEMVMIVDHTGTYQLTDITRISDAVSAGMQARRQIYTIETDKNFGDLVFKGEGDNEVIFISDPFCPFCRTEYGFLKENRKLIGEMRLVHMPMPQLHPTALIASVVMSYAKEILDKDKFSQLIDFSYLELTPGEESQAGRPRAANGPATSEDIQKWELNVVKQFLEKFPELSGGQEAEPFYYFLKGKFAPKVEQEAKDVAQKYGVRGTPATVINGYMIRGFNKVEINHSLKGE